MKLTVIELPPNTGNNRSGNTSSGNNHVLSPVSNPRVTNGPTTGQTSNNANISTNSTTIINLLKQLPQGQTLEAQVKSIQIFNARDKTLLQQVNPSIVTKLSQQLSTGTNHSNATPSATAHSSITNSNAAATTPTTNQQLIAKNTLYLVKLLVSTPNSKPQLLTSITPQLLKVNEPVLLGQRNQQLVIDKLPSQKVQHIAANIIKESLPRQQSVNQLQQFITQLNQIPAPVQHKLLGESTLQAVHQLLTFTHTSNSLQQGQQVRQALNNSGIAMESKVSQQQTTSNALSQDIRTTLDKIITGINNKPTIANNTQAQSNINTLLTPNTNTEITPKELEKIVNSLLPAQSSPSASIVQATNNTLATATAALFRLLGFQLPSENMQAASLPRIIEQHLKKLVEQTQAKIQLNQLRSLGLDRPISESRTALLQQFHTELPLRFNEQVLPLQISIQEQEYSKHNNKEEENNQTEDKKTVQRRWQVFMSFDLPNHEKLHTQLNIVENSISATLWAESSILCQKAQQEMSILRDKLLANGLNVDDLTCVHGKPPQEDFSLDYNLVDIKT